MAGMIHDGRDDRVTTSLHIVGKCLEISRNCHRRVIPPSQIDRTMGTVANPWRMPMVAVLRYFDELEIGLCLRVNRYGRPEAVRRFFSMISRLGDGGAWLLLGGLVLLFRGPQALPFILRAAVIAAIGVTIYKLLKHRLVRERPYMANARIHCGTPPLDRYSFPSGHTLHAVCFTTLFGEFEPLLLFVAAPFAVLVAVSRIVLGLHYPTDVLAGAAIGAALAVASLSI
jgi:undecaprenyl-diphosphatase